MKKFIVMIMFAFCCAQAEVVEGSEKKPKPLTNPYFLAVDASIELPKLHPEKHQHALKPLTVLALMDAHSSKIKLDEKHEHAVDNLRSMLTKQYPQGTSNNAGARQLKLDLKNKNLKKEKPNTFKTLQEHGLLSGHQDAPRWNEILPIAQQALAAKKKEKAAKKSSKYGHEIGAHAFNAAPKFSTLHNC